METSGLFTKEQAIKRKEGIGSGNIIKEGFCSKCGAWKGTLGLEPNFDLYIKHLCDIYDGIKRVLKKTGTCWVNLGDTYAGSGVVNKSEWKHKESVGTPNKHKTNYTSKCLLMIPQRFAIEMIKRGWILRNVIIWYKPNCMPSSVRDRFTVDFEYVFLFVKSNKTQYWINEKTTQLVPKRPLGIKGIENIDWEWRECDKCSGTGIEHKKCNACEGEGWIYNALLQPEKCPYCKGLGRIRQDKECKSCKGKGIKKYNFWKGRQYYFEQQFEKTTTEFIYSRDSQKGYIQEKNNPRNNWGLTKTEIGQYHSKYKNCKYGQTLQGFVRNDSIKKERKISKNIAKEIYPNNKKRQQEYINHVHDHGFSNPLGRNKRTVWTIPTKANPEAHFATFPPKLVEPMIKAGCPKFVCKTCGKPREKLFKLIINKKGKKAFEFAKENIEKGRAFNKTQFSARCYPTDRSCGHPAPKEFLGYSDCGCNAGFDPGIVLDHFTGTATTLLQAWKLGRNYIGFEISEEYCKIANKKLELTNYIRLDNFIYEKQIEV